MYINFIIITASAQTLSQSQLFSDNLAGSLNEIKQPARLRHSSGPSRGGKMSVGGARTGKLMGRLFRPQELAVSVLAHRRCNNGGKKVKDPPSTKGLRPRTDRGISGGKKGFTTDPFFVGRTERGRFSLPRWQAAAVCWKLETDYIRFRDFANCYWALLRIWLPRVILTWATHPPCQWETYHVTVCQRHQL